MLSSGRILIINISLVHLDFEQDFCRAEWNRHRGGEPANGTTKNNLISLKVCEVERVQDLQEVIMIVTTIIIEINTSASYD